MTKKKYEALARPKRKNSKAIGNNFQRRVAKLLNEKFETTDFQNTPGSGAYATTHSLPEHLQIWGDLITPLNFAYVIECKFAYEDTIQDFYALINPKSKIYEFIEQVERDAAASNKKPLLIYAQRRKPLVCFIRSNDELINVLKQQQKKVLDGLDHYSMFLLEDLLELPSHLFYSL
jgi:hypothetical protein